MHLGFRRAYSTFKDVVIVGAARTPVGSFRGSLVSLTAPQLGAIAIQATLKQASISKVDSVIMGNVLSAGLGQAPARQAALYSGLPESTVCLTVNKVCASGLKAVMLAAQEISLGLQETMVAGGMESMSNAPHYLPNIRMGLPYGHQQITDSIIHDGLTCAKYHIHMGECAEETATKYNISRGEQDAYAIESYRRAAKATADGLFKSEIVPITMDLGKKGTIMISEDEEFKKINFDKVPSLKPAFQSTGTITAANSSTLNDGASAVLLTKVGSSGGKPLARILSMADAECNPKMFTIAPSLAVPMALERAGLKKEQIDLWEINEAFSVVALANIKLLGLDPGKVNIWGGAVSLGHPIGSSGCRLLVTLINQLKSGQKGCVAICNGGGGASAMIIEKL